MKKALRIGSWVLLAAGLLVWLVGGANRGWTKTRIPVVTLDEVTGIEGITYRKQWSPGLDFLAGVATAALLPAGVSFFLGNSKPKPTITPK